MKTEGKDLGSWALISSTMTRELEWITLIISMFNYPPKLIMCAFTDPTTIQGVVGIVVVQFLWLYLFVVTTT